MVGVPSPCLCVNLGLVFLLVCVEAFGEVSTRDEKIFTNGWAIRVHGGLEEAKKIAKAHGFEDVHPIGSLEGYYHLEHPAHPRLSRRSAEDRTSQLLDTPGVAWAEQQHEKVRVKRGHFHDRMVARGIIPRFKDPLWDAEWYLDDKRKDKDLDIQVIPVWNQGITGKGVVVTILDDGIEHNHTDIIKNYDPNASWDVNGRDSDPFPRYDPTNENKHGTRCAGEVAAQANNTKCGVGVAFNARIGGVRMLDGRVTDKVEAESLSLNPQYIDIYSASWGPSDDGATVEGPGALATAAFLNGIEKGRAGLGSIFIWASGNGGRHGDSCNCDGYTDSIYTLSISSASDHGESPWYSESCSSTLATTFSSGAHGEKRIVTTDLHDTCTERHTGTSASAPLAAGIIALALEKNPKLTWRDVQHIVVWTSNYLPLKKDNDWTTNGVGLKVNSKFGFGLLVAEKIVNMADPAKYKTVPKKRLCRGQIHQDAKPIKPNQNLTVPLHASGCPGTKDEIRYLEHVQLLISLDYTRRGDLVIYLTSPMGTKSCLLPPRKEDMSNEGFSKWPFMTTHSWGEDPRGVWTLEIKDAGDTKVGHGTLREWQLIFHGTKEKPNHQTVTHPDKPRHPVPVPSSPKLSYSAKLVPIKNTYIFGPPPVIKKPFSYTTYTSPPIAKPTKPTQAKQVNNPKALIPYPQQHPATHLIVAQVQRINPQLRARIAAQKFAQQQALIARQKNLHALGPPLYGPQRTPQAFVPKPSGYIAPQAAHYYRTYYAPNRRPTIIRNPYLRTRIPFQPAVRWNGFYPNTLFGPYQYMRTLGRRGLFAKGSFQRSRHNRLSKLRKKWRKKAH